MVSSPPMSRALAFWLALAPLLAGCKDDDHARCEKGYSRSCAWNDATQAYDRDCKEVCSESACLPFRNGPPVQMRCRWDDQTKSYTRDCTWGTCPPDDSAPRADPDGGACGADAAWTTYYSNDPRCADAATK
jgi:hypothetical protein